MFPEQLDASGWRFSAADARRKFQRINTSVASLRCTRGLPSFQAKLHTSLKLDSGMISVGEQGQRTA